MAQPAPQNARFTETQEPRQVWIWIIVLGIALLAWWAFIQQIILREPFGQRPVSDFWLWLILIVFGLGLPVLFAVMRLHTIVEPDRLVLRFVPLRTRQVPLSDIRRAYAREYRPIREYGGWGIRWFPGRGMVYSMSGKEGVQLELANGKRLLVGSRRPEQLLAAIVRKSEAHGEGRPE